MNPVHLHLMLNHVTLFGSIVGLLLLLIGVWRRSDEVKRIACGALVTGAVALLSFVPFRRGRFIPNWFTAVVLLVALLTSALMARTASLGGKVRHTEITGGATAANAEKSQHEHAD